MMMKMYGQYILFLFFPSCSPPLPFPILWFCGCDICWANTEFAFFCLLILILGHTQWCEDLVLALHLGIIPGKTRGTIYCWGLNPGLSYANQALSSLCYHSSLCTLSVAAAVHSSFRGHTPDCSCLFLWLAEVHRRSYALMWHHGPLAVDSFP